MVGNSPFQKELDLQQGVSTIRKGDWKKMTAMMELVYVLVQRSPVQYVSVGGTSVELCSPMKRPVSPIMEHVFEHKEKRNLRGHLPCRGEGYLVCRHTKVFADRVEDKDQRELAEEMGEEDDFEAVTIFFIGRQFGL